MREKGWRGKENAKGRGRERGERVGGLREGREGDVKGE